MAVTIKEYEGFLDKKMKKPAKIEETEETVMEEQKEEETEE